MHCLLLTSTNEPEFVLNLAKAISEYGILVVIAAIYLFLTLFVIRRLLNNYSKTIDSTISEIKELRETIQGIQKSFNEVMSNHNAHSNQSLKTLERNEKDVRDIIMDCQKTLKEIQSEMIVIRNGNENMFRFLIANSNKGYTSQLPTMDVDSHDDYGDVDYREDNDNPNK